MKKITSRNSLVLALGLVVVSVGQSQLRSGKFGIGFNGAAYLMQSDYVSQPPVKFGGGLGISWSVMEHLGIRANLSGGQLGWKQGTVENTRC